jgi:copper chaperone CopZ
MIVTESLTSDRQRLRPERRAPASFADQPPLKLRQSAEASAKGEASRRRGPASLDKCRRIRLDLLSILALLLLIPAQVRAEYRRIELRILGMDCAICAHGVRVAFQKVDGVESVELSLERAQADIRLRKDNIVSLDRFRRIVKANGFEPRQATVTALGTVREVGGKLAFEVSGVTPPLIIAPDASAPAAYKQLKSAADGKSTAIFEVVGTVETKGDVEGIAIASVK